LPSKPNPARPYPWRPGSLASGHLVGYLESPAAPCRSRMSGPRCRARRHSRVWAWWRGSAGAASRQRRSRRPAARRGGSCVV